MVSKRTKPASDKQRGYQWGVVYKMIAEISGHTPQEIHEALAFQFLRISDGPLTLRRSTESLTTVEKEEYLANCRQFAQEFYDCRIPLPNEVDVPEYN